MIVCMNKPNMLKFVQLFEILGNEKMSRQTNYSDLKSFACNIFFLKEFLFFFINKNRI